MGKFTYPIIFGIVLLVSASLFLYYENQHSEDLDFDPQNATYIIDGQSVTLRNGYYEGTIEGSASKEIVRYFGNEATGDFNGDGHEDTAFLLTRESGGSGTFYYVVAYLSDGSEYRGTNAVLLGDRIAPQTTEFRDGHVIVNFADRKVGDSFADAPSVGVSKYLQIDKGMLSEIPADIQAHIDSKSDLIRLDAPQPLESISSPVTLIGEARGYWFFEASFPVIVTNWDGLIIGQGYAQAQDEWMTEDFVPFKAVVEFDRPDYKDNGTLILKKDNPSGLPEHDDALEIPIYFQ